MRNSPTILPPKFLACMSPEDRAPMGKAGLTTPEIDERQAVKQEKVLHNQIANYCRLNNWLTFHGAMHRASNRTEGEPDFHICLPGGRILHVECKTATGRLSDAQTAVYGQMRDLGHVMHIVRSLSEFIALLPADLKRQQAVEQGDLLK